MHVDTSPAAGSEAVKSDPQVWVDFGIGIAVGIIIGYAATSAISTARGADLKVKLPENRMHQSIASDCRALRELNHEHRGRPLTGEEKAVKAQLVVWYNTNCKSSRKAAK